MKKFVAVIVVTIFSCPLFAQKFWNVAGDMPGNQIPTAGTNVHWEDSVVIVPAGYSGYCNRLELDSEGYGADNSAVVIIEGTLTVYDRLQLEANNDGAEVESATIIIRPGGRLVVYGWWDHDGDATADDSRLIDIQGTLDLHCDLPLSGTNEGVPVGFTLRMDSTGVINIYNSNGESGSSILTIGSVGIVDYHAESRINFACTSGNQNISNDMVYPNVAVTGGNTLYLSTSLDSASLTGNIIVESGIIDIKSYSLSGNQTNKIVVDSAGIFKIGGTNSFPTSDGSLGAFQLPELNKWSTVEYDGENTQNIASLDYWNLTLSDGNLGTDGIKLPESGITIAGVLSVEDDVNLNTSNGSITILSTGDNFDETGMIGVVSGFISGDSVIVHRKMDLTNEPNNRYGWNDWCSPIVGNTIKSWANCCLRTTGFTGSNQPWLSFNSVLFYDASTITSNKNDGWVGATHINNETGLGTGVRVYDGNFDNILKDTGAVFVGDTTLTLSYKYIGDFNHEGWNLLGNPYACAIDWSALYSDGIAGDVYNGMWMYSNAYGYYTYNGVTGIGTGVFTVDSVPLNDPYIPSHKAFWMKSNGAGATVTFKESHKHTGGAYYLKTENKNKKLIRMQIESTSEAYKSAAVVAFNEEALMELEDMDMEFLKNMVKKAPGIATYTSDSVLASINTIPFSSQFIEIPLYITIGKAGNYNVRFYDFNSLVNHACFYLLDKETNAKFPIQSYTGFNFDFQKQDYHQRFVLVIGSPISSEIVANPSCFDKEDGAIQVNWNAFDDATFEVYKNDSLWFNGMEETQYIYGLSAGSYKFIVSDSLNKCAGFKHVVELTEPDAIIAKMFVADSVFVGDSVFMKNESIAGKHFYWNFGDDSESFEKNPTHVYQHEGVYEINLVALSEELACPDYVSKKIKVNKNPETQIQEAEVQDKPYTIIAMQNGIKLIWRKTVESAVKTEIFAVNGELAYQYELSGKKGEELFLKTSDWSAGVYLISMYNHAEKYLEKIVK